MDKSKLWASGVVSGRLGEGGGVGGWVGGWTRAMRWCRVSSLAGPGEGSTIWIGAMGAGCNFRPGRTKKGTIWLRVKFGRRESYLAGPVAGARFG